MLLHFNLISISLRTLNSFTFYSKFNIIDLLLLTTLLELIPTIKSPLSNPNIWMHKLKLHLEDYILINLLLCASKKPSTCNLITILLHLIFQFHTRKSSPFATILHPIVSSCYLPTNTHVDYTFFYIIQHMRQVISMNLIFYILIEQLVLYPSISSCWNTVLSNYNLVSMNIYQHYV